jgi:hypothetical protein
MNKNSKRVLAVGVSAAVLAGTGIAYAYWTSQGEGTGSATVGTTSRNITLHATSTNTAAVLDSAGHVVSPASNQLYPGGPAAALQVTGDNPNSYSVSLDTTKVVLSRVTCAGDTATEVTTGPDLILVNDPATSVDELADNGTAIPKNRLSWFTNSPASAVTQAPGYAGAPVLTGANDVINSTTQLAPHSLATPLSPSGPPLAVAMLDSTQNQNVCKGTTIDFVFTTNQV